MDSGAVGSAGGGCAQMCKSDGTPAQCDTQAQWTPVHLLSREVWPGPGGCAYGRAVAWSEPVLSWPYKAASTQEPAGALGTMRQARERPHLFQGEALPAPDCRWDFCVNSALSGEPGWAIYQVD